MLRLMLNAGGRKFVALMAFILVVLPAIMIAVGVYAQAPGVPTVSITSPTGQEQIQVVGPGAGIVNVTTRQLRDAAGYTKIVPTTGQTIQVSNGTSRLVMNPAGTLASLTITLPQTPVDGQVLFVFSTQAVTTVTLTPGTGATINNAITTLAANGTANYIYSASNQTWDRD